MATDAPLNKTSTILRKLAAEAGPLILFFISFMIWDIYVATAVFMAAMVLSVASTYVEKRRLPTFPLLGLIMVLVFGGLTLWLGEATFIKIKPTVSNALFGSMILGGLLIGVNFISRAFGDQVTMREAAWRTIALRTGAFFLVLAGLNEVVRLTFSTEAWVWFKVFGILPMDAAFLASQWPLIRRERQAATAARENTTGEDEAAASDARDHGMIRDRALAGAAAGPSD